MNKFLHFNTLLISLLFINFSLCVNAQQVEVPESVEKEAQREIVLAETSEKNADFNTASSLYHKVGNTYWAYGNTQQAITFFSKALSLSRNLGNQNAQYVLNTNIGLIYSDLTDFSKALEYFQESFRVAGELGRKYDITSSQLNKANVLFELGRYDEAIADLENVNANAQELNDSKLLRNTYSLLTKIYDVKGNREESAKYFDLFAALTQKIQQDEMRKKEEEANKKVSLAASKVQEIEAQKDATEKELLEKDIELMQKQRFLERAEQESRERLMQIELLSKESELQQAIISRQKLMRNIYIIIILTILSISGLIYHNYWQKKKANLLLQQKNEEISRQNVEIQNQAEQLRELNHVKDKLFSIISHDLRSPLGSLVTLLNLTKQGYFTEEGFNEVLAELSINVGYTSSLLENLLGWAQSQLQGIVAKPSNFSLHEVVESKSLLFSDSLKSKSISFKNNIESNVWLYADRDMIDLVVRNLVANAIKFTPEGGEIVVSSTNKQRKVEVCISDSGVGISDENMPKLFGNEMYSTQGTSSEKGTGLGLALCKDFVQLNNGRIWAESTVNSGSMFYFSIQKGEQELQARELQEQSGSES